MKRLDALLGPVLVRLVKVVCLPPPQKAGSPGKVLFIRPGGIGDAILLIPAIQTIKKKFPSAMIHLLAEKRNADIFALCPDVEQVFRYDRPAELMTAMRGSYDIVIDTEQWHRLSAVVSRLIRAPMSAGFATNERKQLFTHEVPYSHDDYEVDSFLHLIEPLAGKIPFDPLVPFLAVPVKESSQIEAALRPLSNKRIVVLFPGGSIAERQWGIERFHSVAEQMSKMGYGIVVIGGKEDFPAGEGIVSGISASLNLCGRLSLPESAAVLSISSLLITGDSGIMHLGYAVGTRVLALFGPGIENKWAPRSPRVAILNKRLPCSPCTEYGYTPKCPRDTACMKGISTQDVVNSAMELLNKD